jgi:16S rRNA (guanine(966)-N(2))-methyltransferase RsmD
MQNQGGAGSKPAFRQDRGYRPKNDSGTTRRVPQSGDDRFRSPGSGSERPVRPRPSSGAKNYYGAVNKFKQTGERQKFSKRPIRGSAPVKREPPIKIYSDMQITDGRLRGKLLHSTLSPRVRPTARQIREALFKNLLRRTRASRFLDICAGSGMVGIEAISRGACLSTFVERSAKMCSFIKKNLENCGVKSGHGEIFEIEAIPFLMRMEKRRRVWDVVYYDPPYDTDYNEVLAFFARGVALRQKGVLVIEHHSDMFFPEEMGQLRRWRVVSLGETSLTFYERR